MVRYGVGRRRAEQGVAGRGGAGRGGAWRGACSSEGSPREGSSALGGRLGRLRMRTDHGERAETRAVPSAAGARRQRQAEIEWNRMEANKIQLPSRNINSPALSRNEVWIMYISLL